jgi:hypothetical protein
MGLSRWIRNGIEIDLPLLERLAEIEIDERAGGDIKKTEQAKALARAIEFGLVEEGDEQ